MERRSWLWKRKSSERFSAETETTGSVSSLSERNSDDHDQEVSRSSPAEVQSPEISSGFARHEEHDTVKELTRKLSSALANIRAKEDLAKQHAKVAIDAVAGWEKAEFEVATLKQQLRSAAQKNSALEEQKTQLDSALKECIRQLRQARAEQERESYDLLEERAREWEDDRFELESRVAELEARLEAAARAEPPDEPTTTERDLRVRLGEMEKETAELKLEVARRSEMLRVQTLESELCTRAAEAASKQHLESLKKMSALESECRKLRAIARKERACKDTTNSNYNAEFMGDRRSQADDGDQSSVFNDDPRRSNSGVFAGEKNVGMEDFLEMERAAATPVENQTKLLSSLRSELEAALQKTASLEKKSQEMEREKSELETILAEKDTTLEAHTDQLDGIQREVAELRRQLDNANDSRQVSEIAAEAAEARREVLESELDAAVLEAQSLRSRVRWLEGEVERQKWLAGESELKLRRLEDEVARSKEESAQRAASINGLLTARQDKQSAAAAGKLTACQRTIASLGQQLKSLASLGEMKAEMAELESGGEEERKMVVGGDSLEPSGGPGLSSGKENRSPTPPSFTRFPKVHK